MRKAWEEANWKALERSAISRYLRGFLEEEMPLDRERSRPSQDLLNWNPNWEG